MEGGPIAKPKEIASRIAVCLISFVGILVLFVYGFARPNALLAPQRPFDSTAWKKHKSFDPDRLYMIDDLLAHYNLRGKPKSEVIKLLGKPDDDELKSMKGNYCKPGQITYELGAELDNPMSFNRNVLELTIENDRLSNYRVTVYRD